MSSYLGDRVGHRWRIRAWVNKIEGMVRRLWVRHAPDLRPELRQQIAANPDAGQLYYQLGQDYYERRSLFPSIALFRTALAFGDCSPQVILALAQSYLDMGLFDLARQQLAKIEDTGLPDVKQRLHLCLVEGQRLRPNTWKPEYLGYGKYQRLKIVSDRIADLDRSNELMVADVGGGQGQLCLFIPKHRYALLEPSITGVSAPNILLGAKAFDIVVFTDVLEHAPKRDRKPFVAEMMRLARRRVYFTAPFGEQNRQLEIFFYKLTKNPWTKEHLAHEVSTLKEMKSFLEKQGVAYRISPCSFLPTHFAMGYLDNHWLRGNKILRAEVNEFFNTHYCDLNRQEPSYGYLFELMLSE